ncbi:MAG: PD-(D/E)XK nuclease-like domain-containing protein [Firmicutes bacterium]|nr:PD-(D/E)XK nuclease-like domain-containing protein [Bacillota bacterium]
MLKLTRSNYYSAEANKEYFSASQVKSFLTCEAATMAELRGEWTRPESVSLLIGSYIDASFESKAAYSEFVRTHPQIFKRDGSPKAEYAKADQMIQRAKADAVFMKYMSGRKQVIKTGFIGGIPFKARFDAYKKGVRIVDLKTVKDMQTLYKPGYGRLTPIEYWMWDLQMAIYSAVEGNDLPTYLAIITKEDPPAPYLVEIGRFEREACLAFLLEKLPRFDAIKRGIVEPERCENCAYCRATKRIAKPLTLSELRFGEFDLEE